MVSAELHNIRVRMQEYQRLVQIQGILQLRDKQMYSMADVVREVLDKYPDLEVPIDGQNLKIVEQELEEGEIPTPYVPRPKEGVARPRKK